MQSTALADYIFLIRQTVIFQRIHKEPEGITSHFSLVLSFFLMNKPQPLVFCFVSFYAATSFKEVDAL